MKFTIIGSGGCVALPKPLCKCRICKEARVKGKPYSRFGCSLFLEDIKLLVDTPEDIVQALNYANVQEVTSVLFSHMDPDHTLGMRVFEHMRLNWFEISEGKECTNPISLFAMEHVMSDINSIGSNRGSFLDYYENIRNIIKRNVITDVIYLDDIKLTFVRADSATVFVFEKEERKVIYAPCDVKPFPNNDIFKNADIMIIGNTIVDEVLKDGFIIAIFTIIITCLSLSFQWAEFYKGYSLSAFNFQVSIIFLLIWAIFSFYWGIIQEKNYQKFIIVYWGIGIIASMVICIFDSNKLIHSCLLPFYIWFGGPLYGFRHLLNMVNLLNIDVPRLMLITSPLGILFSFIGYWLGCRVQN
ncbi:MAG TPA: hypothetical protein VIK72_00790 [Clostridiaceae bacterium]